MSTFTIPGTPIPKQRPRRNAKGVWYTPFRTLVYEKKVCLYAKVGRVRRTAAPLRVAIALFLPDRRRRAIYGLNGTAWLDDDQVTELKITKQIDREYPRAEVTIEAT